MKQRDYILFLLNLLTGLGLQLLLSEIRRGGIYLVGYPYVMPLLLIPMQARVGRQLIAAAALGLLVDMLYDTIGVHMAATVALAYAKEKVLSAFTATSLRESQIYPRPCYMGWQWYSVYLVVLLVGHQVIIFALESGFFLANFYIFSSLLKSIVFTWLFFGAIEVVRSWIPHRR